MTTRYEQPKTDYPTQSKNRAEAITVERFSTTVTQIRLISISEWHKAWDKTEKRRHHLVRRIVSFVFLYTYNWGIVCS